MSEERTHAPRPLGHALPADGRCCGRKPIFYKRDHRTNAPRPHHFCTRCDAEYDEGGTQLKNWQWREFEGQIYHKNTVHGAAFDMLGALKGLVPSDRACFCDRDTPDGGHWQHCQQALDAIAKAQGSA